MPWKFGSKLTFLNTLDLQRMKFDKIQKDFDLCWKFGSKMRVLTTPDLRSMKFVRGGTPISNGYRCKARTSIWWEHNLKKLGDIGWECYFWYFSERFKSRNLKKKLSKMAKMINLLMKLKQKVASCGSRMQKIGGLWVRAIEEPTYTKKCGVFWWQQRQSAKIWVIGWQQHWK